MIEIKQISKNFGKIKAVRDLSLSIQAGCVSGLMGPNGSGKTTLIKTILGLVIPDHGKIEVCGIPVQSSGLHRSLIGYLPQNPDFPTNLSVKELLRMVEDIRGEIPSRRQELLELFELEQNLERYVGALSGGTKQKIAAVIAFMFNAPVLILDEPSVGLDPLAATRLKRLIKSEADSGKTVLFVSHVVSETEQLVRDLFFILDGRLVLEGSVDEIVARAKASSLEDAIIAMADPRPEIQEQN